MTRLLWDTSTYTNHYPRFQSLMPGAPHLYYYLTSWWPTNRSCQFGIWTFDLPVVSRTPYLLGHHNWLLILLIRKWLNNIVYLYDSWRLAELAATDSCTLRKNSSPTVYHHVSQPSVDIQLNGLIKCKEDSGVQMKLNQVILCSLSWIHLSQVH